MTKKPKIRGKCHRIDCTLEAVAFVGIRGACRRYCAIHAATEQRKLDDQRIKSAKKLRREMNKMSVKLDKQMSTNRQVLYAKVEHLGSLNEVYHVGDYQILELTIPESFPDAGRAMFVPFLKGEWLRYHAFTLDSALMFAIAAKQGRGSQ